jgi:hypothetical protein
VKALIVALTLLLIAACTKKDEAAAPSGDGSGYGRGTDGSTTGGTTGGTTGSTTGTTGSTTGSTTGTTSGSTTGEVPNGDRYAWPDGATTDVTFNKATLEAFVDRPVNKAGTTVLGKINILLGNRPTATYPQSYAGLIRIAYEEDGSTTNSVYKEYRFEASWHTTQSYAGGSHSFNEKNRFNGYTSATVFKAYTQDAYGSILMVSDRKDDSGLLGGRLYFYNYRNCNGTDPSIVIGPEYADACWLIQSGPYDCRDYLDANSASAQDDQRMIMSIALNPFRTWISRQNQNCGVKYRELVSFNGINGQRALEN